jgi:hypothetical protein
MMRMVAIALAVTAVVGCTDDVDPPWQLDHDRIVAVRAEPPSITAGQTSRLDALLAKKGGATSVATPELARVVSPASLADVLSIEGGAWVVKAPGEDRLAAARSELKLAVDAPVPLQVGVSYAGQTLVATKTLLLGQSAANPALSSILIDGKPPGDAEIVVGKLVKVPLSIAADDRDFDVAWVTSCGTMHDFDLPQAYLKVENDDPTTGEIGVVLRDDHGGVSWKIWPIRAE